jgi:hypothetical protein
MELSKGSFMSFQISKSVSATVAVAALIAASALSGCGQNDAQFNASFDKGLHDSCVTSFTQHGGPADKAEPYCSCIVREADKLSTSDKLTLAAHSEKMTPMAQTCIAQVSGGAAPASNTP